MSVYIRPYKRGSASAKLLRQTLQIGNLKRSTQLKDGDIILNWGGQDDMPSDFNPETMYQINKPESIRVAVSKIESLRAIDLTPFYTSRQGVLDWVDRNGGWPAGAVVYCRTLTRANRGRGIVVAKNVDELVEAPLYTYGYPCKREYRVHVFDGRVIDVVAKVRITDKNNPKFKENPDPFIRNSETGYSFARDAVKIPQSVMSDLSSYATHAVNRLSLTFGAVDIVRDVNNKLSILEVNTAPGIMGSALLKYTEAITDMIGVFIGQEVVVGSEQDTRLSPNPNRRVLRSRAGVAMDAQRVTEMYRQFTNTGV